MRDIQERLLEEFRDPDARREYADEFLASFIALQIKVLRQQRQWNQRQLGDAAEGMKQQQISVLEKANYSSWTIQTLKRLAAAFDLVLSVRFESFGKLLGDITGLSRESLERPSFKDDPAFAATVSPDSQKDALSGTSSVVDKWQVVATVSPPTLSSLAQ